MQTNVRANYTGYGWEGKNYKLHQSTKDIAAEIRKNVRKLYPAKEGYKIGVTYESFAGGSAINIDIKAAPFQIHRAEWAKHYKHAKETRDWQPLQDFQDNFWDELRAQGKYDHREYSAEYTEETMALRRALEKMGNSYRFNDSDGMIDYFDTNFYLHVQVHWQTDKDS